jgi:hypothetical protein
MIQYLVGELRDMLISGTYIKKIYVSIASFVDKELADTVDDILSKARYPKRVFLSILSQEQDHNHPDLQPIFDKYGVTDFNYQKVNYSMSAGVCWARNKTLEALTSKYAYFLQVDSHSRFVKNWDTKIINDYEKLLPFWGNYVFSTYPKAYSYNEDGIVVLEEDIPHPVVKIVKTEDGDARPFEAKYCDYTGGEYGQYTGYFCGGQTFGPSKYFMSIKPDPEIYFQGEEHSLSIRFYEAGVKLVCPPNSYVYHNYNGHLRARNWEVIQDWEALSDRSDRRFKMFIENKLPPSSPYAMKTKDLYQQWYDMHVEDA